MLTCCLFLYLKFFKKINFFLVFSNHFNILISKIIFLKKIIIIYFQAKNNLKNNYRYTSKHHYKSRKLMNNESFFIFNSVFFHYTSTFISYKPSNICLLILWKKNIFQDYYSLIIKKYHIICWLYQIWSLLFYWYIFYFVFFVIFLFHPL